MNPIFAQERREDRAKTKLDWARFIRGAALQEERKEEREREKAKSEL